VFISLQHTKPNKVFFGSIDIYYSGKFDLPDRHLSFSGTISNKIERLVHGEFYSILRVCAAILHSHTQTHILVHRNTHTITHKHTETQTHPDRHKHTHTRKHTQTQKETHNSLYTIVWLTGSYNRPLLFGTVRLLRNLIKNYTICQAFGDRIMCISWLWREQQADSCSSFYTVVTACCLVQVL